MKSILLLAALTLSLHLHAADAAPTEMHEAQMTFQRIMIAGPNGTRLCTGAYGFQFNGQHRNIDASAKESADLAKLDTTKTCTVHVTKNPENHSTVILRVDQAGKTLYLRPDPAPAKKE